ncbi:MAG: hypothetical protein AAGA30_21795 [Planctomycetota bacterium]
MTAVFEKHNLNFMYPDNWKLSENPETDEFIEVSLESPGGSIWSVSIFADPEGEPHDLVESCATALSEQYEDFERFEFEGEIAGIPAVGFDSHFYCLDFLVTAQSRALRHEDRLFNIFCQAESREFDKNSDVFQAITLSLLSQVKG